MSIDILLVTYNQEPYIQQALDGILMQRVNDEVKLRIIVADDCSTDGTLKVIKARLGDSNVLFENGRKADVLYLPNANNMGHVRNYQRAFKECKADYVAVCEGDDYWVNPLHLQEYVDFMDMHRECILTSQNPIWYYEEDKRFAVQGINQIDYKSYRVVPLKEEIQSNQIVNLSSCVIRGSVLPKLDKRIYTCSILDWPMYINMCQYGILCILPGATVVYRSKKSGLYAGLNDKEQLQADINYLNEIATIFPEYMVAIEESKLLRIGKRKSAKRIFAEALLMPIVICARFAKKVKIVYQQLL